MTRRGSAMPWLVAAALLLVGCVSAQRDVVVPAGPLAPVVPGLDGQPPVECRGVPLARCREFGIDPGANPGADPAAAGLERYIVTCTTTCTANDGRVLIHRLGVDGVVTRVAEGVYGE